jgi:hypothetical protein
MKLRVLWALGLLACSEEVNTQAVCEFPDGIAAGSGQALIDGEDWTAADVAWIETGSGLQVTTGMNDGWRLTLVVQGTGLDSDGLGIVELDGSGGWGLVYPDDGSSYSSQEIGGSLELVTRGDTIELCFDLDAAGEDGEVSIEEGYLHADALDLGR